MGYIMVKIHLMVFNISCSYRRLTMENSIPTASRGRFKSNFGFLMASIGSAVGLGNLWGFPYKMGIGGGFAFLILYVIMVFFIGFSLMLAEYAIGRKAKQGPVGAYGAINRRFAFNGWFATFTPFFLLPFYTVLGGYCIKYMFANISDIFGASSGIGQADSGEFFGSFLANTPASIFVTLIFIACTLLIVALGVEKGIEKFSVVAMPALYIMLIIIVIRSVTLPGAVKGLEFMFKPDFTVFKEKGFISVLALAGGQLFFSLSLASGCQIAYGSYLSKSEDLEKNALIVPIADMIAAILAGLATLPAAFAAGLEPTSGPGMLFVVLQTVFSSMGKSGPYFGSLFYILLFLAALSSSIGMLEGASASFIDNRLKKGKSEGRVKITLIITAIILPGAILVASDGLGSGNLPHIFGFSTWLEAFDLFGEGILMPLGGFFMAIILGWLSPNYMDDEVRIGSEFKTQKFFNVCIKFIAPAFMVFILIGQIDSFFALGIFK
jgi:NSS family neurotransmitter:Na+ symporter